MCPAHALLQEQNMVAKTIGFNWGPAGTSTGMWTGVRLADVLRHCSIKGAEQAANYVCFRGPKNELPQGQFWPLDSKRAPLNPMSE